MASILFGGMVQLRHNLLRREPRVELRCLEREVDVIALPVVSKKPEVPLHKAPRTDCQGLPCNTSQLEPVHEIAPFQAQRKS